MVRELYPQLSGLLSTQPTLNLLDSVALCQHLIHTPLQKLANPPSKGAVCFLCGTTVILKQMSLERERVGSDLRRYLKGTVELLIGLTCLIFCFYHSIYVLA